VVECLVIGIGNPDRGDDAIGRSVARTLRARVAPVVRVIEQDGEATALLAELQTAQRAWLVDAAQSSAPPGTISRIDCAAEGLALPSGTVSSHGFGVVEAIALARALDVLPKQCVVYAIEAADFTAGTAPSSEVVQAAEEVAERILAELRLPPNPPRVGGRGLGTR
jgi:hydrogenase maturation protease